ncbi:MAG: hypothetical protein JWR60_2978 [Polaromonas sp.]|nr:hypothetical protein [Polaromonas sp.]
MRQKHELLKKSRTGQRLPGRAGASYFAFTMPLKS